MSLFSFLNNPITLAAAAVIAIGVIVYEIVSQQKEERAGYRGSGGPGRGGRGPGRGGRGPGSGSDSGRSESCNSSSYGNTINNVRRRKLEETKTKSCAQSKVSKTEEKGKLSCGSKDSTPNPEFDEKHYYQNVFDKIGNDVKNINKENEEKKSFHKNIPNDVSDPSANLTETKLVNTNSSDANKGDVQWNTQNALSEKANRKNIYCQGTNTKNYNDPGCSASGSTVDEKQNDTKSDNPLCKACEEVFANTVVYPCKHCYLCIDCATIVHRIYKKCSICESSIDYFETVQK